LAALIFDLRPFRSTPWKVATILACALLSLSSVFVFVERRREWAALPVFFERRGFTDGAFIAVQNA